MIHIALDTSIYRKKPRLDSPEFRALFFLAKNGCICLHVPYFVEKEFTSYIENEQRVKVDSTIKSLNKIQNYHEQGTHTKNLVELSQYLIDNKKEIINERSESFINWLSHMGAIRYGLSEAETKQALDAYFYGEAPLKEPKVRKDIPDSFIFQTLLKIQEKESIQVVVHDGALFDACKNEGMVCYKELNEFIEDKGVKECLQGKIKGNILNSFSEYISKYLEDNSNTVLDKIEALLLNDDYRLLSGDNMPGESNEIYVSGVDYPDSLIFDTDIEYYGDGLFAVGFEACIEFTYEYAVHRSEIYDYDREKYCIEGLNDHYFNVETTDNFKFSGRVELEYDISLQDIKSVKELFQVLSEPSITIDDLDGFTIN